MPDAMEAARQDTEQEAADELVGGKRHDLLPVGAVAAIVLVAKGDTALIEPDEAPVRDRDPVGVAGQVGEHCLWSRERRLSVNHPTRLPDGSKMAQECPPLGEVRLRSKEGEATSVVERDQPGEEQPAELCPKHSHREQEGRARRDPAAPVERDAAARHDHVHVGMVRHRRTPGVEHSGDADVCSEMLPICRDRQHRLRCRLEQQVVDERLVVEGDVGHFSGQREHDVEVSDRQKISLTLGKPSPRDGALALRTVPVATGVVGDPPLAAGLTRLNVTAERRGAAVLNR